MKLIQLKKDGLYYGKEKLDEISSYLNYAIGIAEEVTLYDLFNIILEFDIEDINLLFNGWTRGFLIEKYYKYMISEVSDDDDNELIYLDISWATDYFKYEDDDCVEQSDFSSYIDVSGSDGKDTYGISLTPINRLKDLIIRIDNTFEIFEYKGGPDIKSIFKSDKEISLYEFIGGILYEISFHGYPDDKNEIIKSLEETKDLIDSGDMEMISQDSFTLKFLKKDLARLIKDEKYEKAAKVKKEIEELEEKIKKEDDVNDQSSDQS